jgi:hypothetical protein
MMMLGFQHQAQVQPLQQRGQQIMQSLGWISQPGQGQGPMFELHCLQEHTCQNKSNYFSEDLSDLNVPGSCCAPTSFYSLSDFVSCSCHEHYQHGEQQLI